MKPYKGTLSDLLGIFLLRRNASLRKFTFLILSTLLWAISLFAATPQQAKPLYLSYEKRLILTYLLAGAGESEEQQLKLATRLERMMARYVSTPVVEKPIHNFDEFLQIYKGPWPDSYSVASDLQLIETVSFRGPVSYRAVTADGRDNPALQGQIEGFIRSQNQRMLEGARQVEAPITILNPLADQLLESRAKGASLQDRRTWILLGFNKATEILQQQFKLFETVGVQIANSNALDGLDGPSRLFLETVLKEYFTRTSVKTKKQMISRFMGLSLTSGPTEKFKMMLMASGPQFQKFLQIVASGAGLKNSEVKDIIELMLSKVFPIPGPIAQKLFESERGRYNWVSYELKPLGTGTMAQVHKGIIRTPHGDLPVVIRFLKPEIEDRVAEDARILAEIAEVMDADPRFKAAGFPKLKPMVADLNKTVADELILSSTVKLQKAARNVYNRTTVLKTDGYKNFLRINVPYLIDGGEDSKLMVQELVIGRMMKTEIMPYQEMLPHLGKSIIENIAIPWAGEAFFRSGVYHADLHQGNFLVNITDEEIVLSPLDFGMGGVLWPELQEQLVLFAIGIEMDRPELIAKALWMAGASRPQNLTLERFIKKVAIRAARIRQGAMKQDDSSEWLNWAMDEGIVLPYELVNLNRGITILDQALAEVGSDLTIAKISEKLAPKMGRSIIMSLYKKGFLKYQDLAQIGYLILKSSEPTEIATESKQSTSKQHGFSKAPPFCRKVYGDTRVGALTSGVRLVDSIQALLDNSL
jgi:predicted unusual protein kinase regulating ubiquinone biosynthesis (AarF/ABC1/UbiB family)